VDGQDLTLHAYDAEDLQDNLFARQGSSLDIGAWVAGSPYGNSFQVPTVIHGKVFTGSADRLVVFGLKHRPRCTPTVQCDDAVAFHCTKDADSDEFDLQRKQGEGWESLAGPGASKTSREFASLWDYVKDDSVTYRICTKARPDECTDEFPVKSSHRSCGHGAKKSDADCGSQGKPPCFLEHAWPIDTRASEGPRPGRN